MDLDESPVKIASVTIGESLDHISVTELEQRINSLEAEIARTRQEIVKKQTSRSAADAFFQK